MYDDFHQYIFGFFYSDVKCDLLTIIWVHLEIHWLFHPVNKIKIYIKSNSLIRKTVLLRLGLGKSIIGKINVLGHNEKQV